MSTISPRHREHAPAVASHAYDVEGTHERPTPVGYVLAAIRLSLGWVFLWAFLDKTFGLGHETPSAGAWIDGGSPTNGFLSKGTTGPFADFYQSFAGAAWADWLFMIGLLGIGVALILGVAMRLAAASGALLLFLMWTAVLPPANNLFMDDHLIYGMTLIALTMLGAGHVLGLGRWWSSLSFVEDNPWLK